MEKTLIFDGNGSNGCCDPMAAFAAGANSNSQALPLMAMMNGGGMGGYNGMWNNPIWAIVFLAALQNGGLFGNRGYGMGGAAQGIENSAQLSAIREQLGTNQNTTLLMDAIKGNSGAIHELASSLDCDFNAIQTAINGVQSAICAVGNQVGMGTAQVINAIQNGNCSLANQLSQCCCDLRNAITTQGFEARLQNTEQTTALITNNNANFQRLTDQIAAQTQMISDKFCEVEKREMQREINNLRDERTQFQMSALSQTQTQNIINTLKPCPIPAYLTCSPYQSVSYGGYGYGYPFGYDNNNNCGC